MTNWIVLSFGFLSASTCLSIFMLRRYLRPAVFLCNCVPPKPRRAVITGATSGLGLATARQLARMGWSLVLGCRDVNAGAAIKEQLLREYGAVDITISHLDLTDMFSIARFARDLPLSQPIEVLISNAGIMASRRIIPSNNLNIDSNMLTNCFGPFCLFNELIPHFKIVKGLPESQSLPRVIFVSSALGARGELSSKEPVLGALPVEKWTYRLSYANSKQALNLCAQELARRYGMEESAFLNVYTVVTGGMVDTNLNREMLSDMPVPLRWILRSLSKFVLKTPEEGCQSILHCAVSDDAFCAHLKKEQDFKPVDVTSGGGCLYRNCVPVEWPLSSQSQSLAKAIYAEAEAIYSREISSQY